MSSPFEAYRPPELTEHPAAAAGGSRRPGWLTAICVLAIIIAVLGFFGSVTTLFNAALGRQIQLAMRSQPQANLPEQMREMQQIQTRFEDETYEVQRHYIWTEVLLGIAGFVVSSLLIGGGIQGMGLKARGRTLLIYGASGGIAMELFRIVRDGFQIRALLPVVDRFIQDFGRTASGPGLSPETFASITRGVIIAGFVFGLVVVGLKVLFFVLSLRYLQKPKIQALFGVDGPSAGG